MQNKDKVSISMTALELGMIGINAGTYVQGSEGVISAFFKVLLKSLSFPSYLLREM